MSVQDLSSLTLPQIASAVATGEVDLADAEAELRRRPTEPTRERAPRRPPPRPRQAELERLLVETRRELRQTARRLAQLGKRLEELTELVEEESASSVPRERPRRREGDNESEFFHFDQAAA